MSFDWHIASFMAGLLVAFFIAGNKTMKKIVDECIKNPKTGQYSRKNVAGTVAFAIATSYCTYDIVHNKVLHEFVIAAYLTFAAACLGISSWEKANVIKADAKKESDDADQEAAN